MDIQNQNLTSKNKYSSFFYSFLFLPKEKREAINIIYAFCQETDNIVDSNEPKEIKEKNLSVWRSEFEKCINGQSKFQVQNETGLIIKKYKIPLSHFYNLFEGMEMDLNSNRYQDFNDLYKYCYNVASTVGLISSEIFGYINPKTQEYAINLGIALQLTNIIRDIKPDAQFGRVYLPLSELKNYEISEQDILSCVYNDKIKMLIEFQYTRALNYYKIADSLLQSEDRHNFIAARIMRNIYFKVLKKIRQRNYNVFEKKIALSKIQKILIALFTIIRK